MVKSEYMTENRKKIFSYLRDHSDTLVSAKNIYNFFEQQNCKINMSTIYRNLERLEKEGTIIKYMSEDGKTALYQYETHKKANEHLHLQCLKCGKVVHLDCHFMDEISDHVSEHHGFDIQCKNSIIYGVCKECKGNEDKQK